MVTSVFARSARGALGRKAADRVGQFRVFWATLSWRFKTSESNLRATAKCVPFQAARAADGEGQCAAIDMGCGGSKGDDEPPLFLAVKPEPTGAAPGDPPQPQAQIPPSGDLHLAGAATFAAAKQAAVAKAAEEVPEDV